LRDPKAFIQKITFHGQSLTEIELPLVALKPVLIDIEHMGVCFVILDLSKAMSESLTPEQQEMVWKRRKNSLHMKFFLQLTNATGKEVNV